MFAAEIPAYIHQFYGIQGAAAFPGVTGTMGGDAVKQIFYGYQPGAASVSPADIQVVGNVGEQHGIHALEETIAGIPGLGAE